MQRGPGKPICRNGWHASSCYKQHSKDHFPVLRLKDLDESLVEDSKMEDEDPHRFKEARDRDHLMVPFVCDDCVFFNLMVRSRSLEISPGGDELMSIAI